MRSFSGWVFGGHAAAGLAAALVLGCGNQSQEATESTGTIYQSAVLAQGFSAESVISGLELPTAMRFASDGRIFVAEKRGTIKQFANLGAPATTVADLRTEVMDYWDRGLLDITLHPGYPAQPYLYALYTLDGRVGDSVANGTVPRYRDNCTAAGMSCPVASHLDRIVLDPATGVMVSKTTLIENWGNQFPSHGVGSMQWGPDGFLYISAGDGASFAAVDYGNSGNPLGDPPNAAASLTPPSAMGGALRSQVITPPAATPPFPTWFDGKVLRVNPETMTPLLDPKTVPAPAPIVASGLRNPFRMTFRAGTNELWIADVGWDAWEEIDRIPDISVATTTPANFGWPCFEGNGRQGGYEGAGLSICQNLYNTQGSVVAPHYAYAHGNNVVPGDGCGNGGASITGLAFYDAAAYPAAYQGALFFSDYARQCTWFLPKGSNGLPEATPQLFAQGAGAPVQLTVGPDGDLYYVDIQAGAIGRFHYTPDNRPPVARLTSSATSGLPPFSVTFDASTSTDEDVGDTLTFAWDLDGDGAFDDGSAPVVSYEYTQLQNVTVKVRVTDSKGANSIASTVITSGSAPVPTIQVVTGTNWSVGSPITVIGSATDAEDGTLAATAFDWTFVLQHCPFGLVCHAHVLEELNDIAQVSMAGPDHDYPTHVDIILTATDSDGLSTSTTLSLNPAVTNVTVNSNPPGLNVALNQNSGAAPQSLTVIRGATTSVSAPVQSMNGTLYQLASWSDGGAATHTLHPDVPSLTLTANFTAIATEQNLSALGTPIALVTAPTGGGSHDLDVIKDGVKPAVGSNNSAQQYDTYDGDITRSSDWVGYSFATPKLFTKLVFQEGQNFDDGGAFDSLSVQTRTGAVWSNVSNLVVTPTYTSLNGVNYETFTLTFAPQSGEAIRIVGAPAGSAHFISVAELEAYGSEPPAIPGNAPPTANAGADRTINVNTPVTLTGSGSDPEGAPLSYSWTQVAGPTVALSGAVTSAPQFTTPATPTSLTFQLVTNDGAQNSQADTVVITVADPTAPPNVNLTASGTPVAFITNPTGGGNKNLAIIKDGIKPTVGSNNSAQQYDTYNGGGARATDWVGYTFTSTKLFNKLVFEEGMGFADGGAFTALGVQVRNGATWTDVSGVVVTPAYAGLNGVSYETFTLTFPGVSGDGIRVVGTPAGSAHFISIAELEAYGSDQAGPPPNLAPIANAGPDQSVILNASVTLAGSGSDPEGAALTYLWSQIGGPVVTLSSTTVAAPTFSAPAAPTTLTFQLVTNDGTQASTPDTVIVSVSAPTNLPPTANAGPDQNVLTGANVTLTGSGSDPEGVAVSYAWTQTGGAAVTLSSTTAASPTFTAPGVASTLTFQLVTRDGVQDSIADSVVINVAPPVNLPPTANAGPDLSVKFGDLVTLSGSGADPEGSTIGYTWSQIGGPAVTLSSTTAAAPTFVAPSTVATLTFQLVTNDGAQNSAADSVLVTVNDPSPLTNLTSTGTPTAFITAPTGGGNKNLAIIKDGIKPAVGSNNSAQQYDTYNGGGARASDWFGYTFTSAKTFSRLVFQEGMQFTDGGAFTAASVTVQVRNAGVWSNVSGLVVTPTYPGLNTTNYETFTLNFAAVSGDGIRIFGTPAGSARFTSIAELEVWGTTTAGPPPNLPPSANAGADRTVNINGSVSLSGSGADPEGAAITYAWTQIGGAVVTLTGANTASPSFTAPSSPTTLTFQLVTSDGTQSGTPDTVDVVVTDPAAVNLAASGTPVAFITAPTGGGSKNLGIIKDGVKPAVGSNNSAQQYDTYNGGGARASDWVGYTFTSAKNFNRVVFEEGMQFSDGGAFTSGSLTVQVRSGGVWTTVTGLAITPAYPALNTTNYETFTLTFTQATGDGIRIFGTPAGSARFISIAELEVYGNN